jgi:hypothetical protein
MPPSSKTRHTLPPSKPKTPSSIIRSSLYTDTQQPDRSSGSSAKQSARQLYFYKSPRNSDTISGTTSGTSASLDKSMEHKTSTKAEAAAPAISHKQSKDYRETKSRAAEDSGTAEKKNEIKHERSVSKEKAVVNLAQEFQETVGDKNTKVSEVTSNDGSVPLDPKQSKTQAHKADSGHYKSKIQSIRENRNRVSLSGDESKASPDAKTHPRVSQYMLSSSLLLWRSSLTDSFCCSLLPRTKLANCTFSSLPLQSLFLATVRTLEHQSLCQPR